MQIADRVYLFDNSADGVDAALSARTEGGQLRKIYAPLPAWVSAALIGVPQHSRFVDLRCA